LNDSNFHIDKEILNKLLSPDKRNDLLNEIYRRLESINESDFVELEYLNITDGKIPVLTVNKPQSLEQLKKVLILVGAQHNEYSGMYGQISYLTELVSSSNRRLFPLNQKQSMMIFFPLMNPYGFLNPKLDNKSGYYLENGHNLNRYWRKLFITNYIEKDEETDPYIMPDNALVFKNFLHDYWEREIEIFLIDFHETSLFRRFSLDLVKNLNAFYKLDHHHKMWIVEYLIKKEDIPKREPFFVKPHSCINHHHFNITINQGEQLKENFIKAWDRNKDKLPFGYACNYKSGDICKVIAQKVQSNLRNIIWDIRKPTFIHPEDHGCLVCMGHSTRRPNTYIFELELDKQLFNLFEENEKCKRDQNYFNKKIENINSTIDIVVETIKQAVLTIEKI